MKAKITCVMVALLLTACAAVPVETTTSKYINVHEETHPVHFVIAAYANTLIYHGQDAGEFLAQANACVAYDECDVLGAIVERTDYCLRRMATEAVFAKITETAYGYSEAGVTCMKGTNV